MATVMDRGTGTLIQDVVGPGNEGLVVATVRHLPRGGARFRGWRGCHQLQGVYGKSSGHCLVHRR
jgi:hypothetical protein